MDQLVEVSNILLKNQKKNEYHEIWEESYLEPWKECIRNLLMYHYKDPKCKLGQISTEFIPNTDYGEGCKYSLFEQAIECTNWMKKTWETYKNEETLRL